MLVVLLMINVDVCMYAYVYVCVDVSGCVCPVHFEAISHELLLLSLASLFKIVGQTFQC